MRRDARAAWTASKNDPRGNPTLQHNGARNTAGLQLLRGCFKLRPGISSIRFIAPLAMTAKQHVVGDVQRVDQAAAALARLACAIA